VGEKVIFVIDGEKASDVFEAAKKWVEKRIAGNGKVY